MRTVVRPDLLHAAGNPAAAREAAMHARVWSDPDLRDRWLRYAFFGAPPPPPAWSGAGGDRRLYARATELNRARMTHLLRLIAPHPGLRVLDVGCGVGGLVCQCRQAGALACGVDLSPETLRLGRRLGVMRLVAGDACALPVAQASYDVVCSANMLEHVRDHEALLGELRRVVRPGGRIIVYTDNLTHVRLRVALRRLVHPTWQIGFSGTDGGHVALSTAGEVARVLRRLGCRTRVVYSLPALPAPMGRWASRFFAVVASVYTDL